MIKTIPKINRNLLAEQICEALKIRIINGEYATGFRLRERVLAKEFEVSTVPIREALRVLRSQGFVNIIPYKGTEVANIRSPEYAKDIYETRAMIECFSIEKTIIDINPKIIMDLEKCLDKIKKIDKEGNYENFDFYFHRAIVEAAGNLYILNIFDDIKFKSPYYDKGIKGKKEVIINYKRHKRIFDYIIAKDIEKAKQEIRDHLTHFIKP